jgi:hypothetical protein
VSKPSPSKLPRYKYWLYIYRYILSRTNILKDIVLNTYLKALVSYIADLDPSP